MRLASHNQLIMVEPEIQPTRKQYFTRGQKNTSEPYTLTGIETPFKPIKLLDIQPINFRDLTVTMIITE